MGLHGRYRGTARHRHEDGGSTGAGTTVVHGKVAASDGSVSGSSMGGARGTLRMDHGGSMKGSISGGVGAGMGAGGGAGSDGGGGGGTGRRRGGRNRRASFDAALVLQQGQSPTNVARQRVEARAAAVANAGGDATLHGGSKRGSILGTKAEGSTRLPSLLASTTPVAHPKRGTTPDYQPVVPRVLSLASPIQIRKVRAGQKNAEHMCAHCCFSLSPRAAAP